MVDGIARGKVTIDTSGIVTAERQSAKSMGSLIKTASDYNKELRSLITTQRQVGSVSQATGGAIASIASRFRDADRAAKKFKNSSLGQIQQGIEQAAHNFAGISAAATVVTLEGLQAAQRVQRLNAMMLIMSGSQQRANVLMEQLRRQADDAGVGFLDYAESAATLLPTVRNFNVDIGGALSVVNRLALLDPQQGTQGATFAVRELLSGSTVSLVSRFELGRGDVRGILERAGGDPQKIIEGLDEMLANMGLTDNAFEQMNAQTGAFSQFRSEVTEALAVGFEPALKFLQDAAKRLAEFVRGLRESDSALLGIAPVFALAAAALAPILSLVSAAIAYRRLARPAALVTAGIVGIEAGKGLVTQLGRAVVNDAGLRRNANNLLGRFGSSSGDLVRIGRGEDAGAVVGERAKQGVVILVSLLLEGAKTIAQVLAGSGNIIGQSLDLLFNIFKLGAALMQQGFGYVQEAFGQVLYGLRDLLNGLGLSEADAIGQAAAAAQNAGQANRISGQGAQIEAQTRLARGLDFVEVQAAALTAGVIFDEAKRTLVGGLVGLLFPGDEVASTMDSAGQGIQQAGRSLAANIAENADLLKNTMTEAGQLLDEFNTEVARAVEERDIKAAREAFDQAVQEAREARDLQARIAQEDAAFYKNRAGQITAHYAGLNDQVAQSLAQQAQALAEYRQEDARRLEDHGQRLAEIQRDTQVAVEQAASRLDAAAVFNALAGGRQQLSEAETQFNTDQQRRAEDFQQQHQQLVANLEKQRQQRQTAFEQQLIDDLTAFQERRAAEAAGRELRRTDEVFDRDIQAQRQSEDYAREDRLRQAAYSHRVQELVQRLTTEGTLNVAFVTQMQSVLSRSRDELTGFYVYLRMVMGAIPAAFSGGQAQPLVAPGQRAVLSFAAGGVPPMHQVVRINDGIGFESAFIGAGATYSPLPTASVSAKTDRRPARNIESITGRIVLGDIADLSLEEVKARVTEGTRQLLAEAGL